MGDLAGEAAQHMQDRVDLADMAEELVAQPLAARGAAHQPGDVDEFQLGGDHLGRFADHRQPVEARVRHADPADIRLDGAERVVGALRRLGRGQGVEQGRLADIGQSDDPAFESHGPGSC